MNHRKGKHGFVVATLPAIATTLAFACGPSLDEPGSTQESLDAAPTPPHPVAHEAGAGRVLPRRGSGMGGMTLQDGGSNAPSDGPVVEVGADSGLDSGAGASDAGVDESDASESDSLVPPPLPVAPMPLISLGLPAYTNYSEYPASDAVDGDYSTVWRTGHDPAPSDPNWVAIDLTSVPAAMRTTVYSVWFNEGAYDYDSSGVPGYTLPGDFTIEASAAPGGGQPPTTGWTTLVSTTGNLLSSGANVLALTGYDWVRFDCTASATNVVAGETDTSLQWNLYDAHASSDSWKFGGDSITANAMGHQPTNDSFDQLVHAKIANNPAFEMAGDAGWSTTTILGSMAAFLADFPGSYFALALGTNDVPANDPTGYYANMTQLVDMVLAAGKVPIVPTIPYTADPAHVGMATYNAEVQALYTAYGAKLVHGPDLYTVIYDGRVTMFDNPTDLHPNAVGNAAIRQAWADAMIANVYGQ
jgi:lysophospholipase L1-like esterase